MSLFRIHGISKNPSHFVNDEHVLIESGSILSCLNTTNGEQNFLLQLGKFECVSCIASNPYVQIFALAIKSNNKSRIELYQFHNLDHIELLWTFPESDCSDVGYSHIDISKCGEYMIAISNIPHLQLEFWSITKKVKLASSNVQSDDIKYAAFSPTSNELFMTATDQSITLWRVYYKFDQYFLTQTLHSCKQRQIQCLVFGEDGNEIIYGNDNKEMVIFDEESVTNDYNDQIRHTFVEKAADKLLFTRYYYVAVFAEEGKITFISKSDLGKTHSFKMNAAIKHCVLTPNYKNLLIMDEEHKVFNCAIDRRLLVQNESENKDEMVQINDDDFIQISQICAFQKIEPNEGFNTASLQNEDCILVQSNPLKMIKFAKNDKFECVNFPIANVSTMKIFHFDQGIDFIALGFNDGHIALCTQNFKIFFAERLFKCNVKQISFNADGNLIAFISSNECKLWFIRILSNAPPKIIGYYKLESVPICCCWIIDSYDKTKIIVSFNNGFVATYDAPIANDDASLLLDSYFVDCEVDFSLTKIMRDPFNERLLCLTEDNKLRAFLLDDDATVFADDSFPYFDDHQKRITDIRIHGDLLMTVGEDGLILMRYLSDPSNVILSGYAHSTCPRDGKGILCAEFVASASKIVTFGCDGSILSWKLDLSRLQSENELIDLIECPMNDFKEIKTNFSTESATFEEKCKKQMIEEKKKEFEPQLIGFQKELRNLRKEYEEIVNKVDNSSDLEKLQPNELIVDCEQYELAKNANEREVDAVRKKIKYENIGRQLVMHRIKEQCWHGMEEKLQIVKGIKAKDLTVHSFPILAHKQKNDALLIKKLQFLRKMNLMEQDWSTKTQDRVRSEFDVTAPIKNDKIEYIWDVNEEITKNKNNKNEDAIFDFSPSQNLKKLLFHPMRLYTNYSKRQQINLLNLRIRELKSSFNKEIECIFKLKTAEVVRINDMAMEIQSIEKELNLKHSKTFFCQLDDDENKEGIFEVRDEEIKVEKVLTESELAERKLKEEEQREREKNSNNDLIERALTEMMNNTLDSKDEVEKLQDTLKKPDFVDTTEQSQWSDEQKQIFAKYEESKLALVKAKEVRIKLVETRLKSLKNDISDICKHFDAKLKSLYDIRLVVMENIYVHELMLIHLANDIVECEQYEKRMQNMENELVRLKSDKEKADKTYCSFNSKLEEAKKKLNDLFTAEKFLEKAFKKEMHSQCPNSDYFDYLFKLFRGKKANLPKRISQQSQNTDSKLLERRTSYQSNATIGTTDSDYSHIQKGRRSVSKSLRNIQESVDFEQRLQEKEKESELLLEHLKESEFEQYAENEEELLINPYFSSNELTNNQQLTDDMLSTLTKPMDLSFSVWNRFCDLRKLKVNKDEQVRSLQNQIASMQAEVNALKSNQQIICESITEIERAREVAICKKKKSALDTELFFNLQQGAVQVEESPVVTDMRQSVLCDRSIIQNLNNIILSAGKQQIERLNEIKEFRRGINLLNWRAKILDLEHSYFTMLTTEYQLRRVTKKDQEVIAAGGHLAKRKNECSSLEKKMNFTKKTMQSKINEKKKEFKKYQMKMAEIEKSNEMLTKQIEKLQMGVASKEDIVNIRGTISVNEEKKQSTQKKMDAVVTRRKLVDLVDAQSQEITFLRNELDRLRRRTFPSFSIAN